MNRRDAHGGGLNATASTSMTFKALAWRKGMIYINMSSLMLFRISSEKSWCCVIVSVSVVCVCFFFFHAVVGIVYFCLFRGFGDVYKV